MKTSLIFLIVLLVLCGCTRRNLTYLSDLEDESFIKYHKEYEELIINMTELRFQPDDLLTITVTSLNPEANSLFNKGEIIPVSNTATPSTSGVYKEGYLVDKEGFVDFPVLGRIKVGGYTKSEVKSNLTTELQNYLKSPIVHIRHLNYRITVIGEVKNPATFTIPSENINIFEALGMAGDMTAYGKRENVMIIREESGVRKVTKVDLSKKNILNSPYFYLKQNDVVYVEPDKARAEEASTKRNNISMGLSVASLLVLVLTRFF